jgi:hypothetical protein
MIIDTLHLEPPRFARSSATKAVARLLVSLPLLAYSQMLDQLNNDQLDAS